MKKSQFYKNTRSTEQSIFSSIAQRSISLYQKEISPHKGYRCAHAQCRGGMSCSAFIQHVIQSSPDGYLSPEDEQRIAGRLRECKSLSTVAGLSTYQAVKKMLLTTGAIGAGVFLISATAFAATCDGSGGGGCGGSGASDNSECASKPNTVWQDKTLVINNQSVTYKQGAGNPAQVALKPEEYIAQGSSPGQKYVTANTEGLLKELLLSDALESIVKHCSNKKAGVLLGMSYPDDFNIEKWVIINGKNGRKYIDRLDMLLNWLSIIINADQDFNNSLLSDCYSGDKASAFFDYDEVIRLAGKVGNNYFND